MRRHISVFHLQPGRHSKRSRTLRLLTALFLLIFTVLLFRFSGGAQAAWSFFPQEERMDGIAGHDALDFISEIYDRISPAVVGVLTLQEGVLPDGNDALQAGSGSGLILRADGYIITNYHVIAAAQEISISLADGRTAEAQLVDAEQGSDLALLKIDLDGLPVAKLGDSSQLRVGDVVFPIGNPGGEQFARSMTMGLISGIDRQMLLSDGNLYSLLQTDAAINPGNSGGPLVNCAGEVIGINSVKIVDADFEGMGFAIPINTVLDFLAGAIPQQEERD